MMKETIQDNKLVELTYKIIDEKTQEVLTGVEFPINYVHGANSILSAEVIARLEGRSPGDVIEVPIDCNILYGPRDESLVVTDLLENVPEQYRQLGMTISMQNDKGEVRDFIVTRIDDETLTLDGNNPLCGRKVIFLLEILSVRDATDEEIETGGKPDSAPEVDGAMLRL